MILGEKIRAIRKAKKISQETLAELSGLHPTYISDIERGKVNASVHTLQRL
ncbi:MAG: helix-turn-helix domain-containing protein [Nitrospinota bacterium]